MRKTTSLLCLALAGLAACSGEDAILNDMLPDVVVDPIGLILVRGASAQLHASIPGYPADEAITWSASNPAIASVDASGLVTTDACGPVGETTVIATWTAHPEKKRYVPVDVAMLLGATPSTVACAPSR